MTKEEKELLIKDLCGRLPYDVIVQETFQSAQRDVPVWDCGPFYIKGHPEKVRPYLRPMSSMTDEEEIEMTQILDEVYDSSFTMDKLVEDVRMQEYIPSKYVDWLNKHHFDYRGLIPQGLALPAPEGMYIIK